MYAAVTKFQQAEKVKQFLLKKKLLHPSYLPVRELGYLYFPLQKRVKVPNAQVVRPKFSFPERQGKITIDSLLAKKLTTNQLKLLPRSQEVVGTLMVLEIPEKLVKKEKLIAEAYLKLNKHISTVVKKTKTHHSDFRLRGVKILAGKRAKETLHHESGVKLRLHLEKTYFSARSANERLRIARQIKRNEEVLVMFSGCGPYPLIFSKQSKAKKIYGIEMNPSAHQYALENVRLNKCSNIRIYEGDVRKIVPKLRRKFDRIVMPLPKTGEEFLPLALKKSRKGTIIHLYTFLNEKDIAKEARRLRKAYPVRMLRKVTCGQFAPGVFRVCFDMKVL
jgi:tRNA (guanine37-N1)-methyltransferase